jgi:hypothetical protein
MLYLAERVFKPLFGSKSGLILMDPAAICLETCLIRYLKITVQPLADQDEDHQKTSRIWFKVPSGQPFKAYRKP